MRTIVNTELHHIGGGMAASEPQEYLQPPPSEQSPDTGSMPIDLTNDPGVADFYWLSLMKKAG